MPPTDPPSHHRAESHGDLRSLARGGALNLAGAAIGAALGFAFTAVASRRLGAAEAGVFFSLVALTSIASTTVQLGAPTGLVRMLAGSRALRRRTEIRPLLVVGIGPVAIIALLGGGALILAAHSVAQVLVSHRYTAQAVAELHVLGAWVVADAILTICVRACQGLGRLLPLVVVGNVLVPLSRLVILTPLAAHWVGTPIAVAWTVPAIIGAIVCAAWLGRISAQETNGATSTTLHAVAGRFWSFTAFQGVSAVIQILLLWLDVLLVGAIRSSHEAGVYNAASRYLSAGSLVLTSVVFVIGPLMSGLMARDQHERARVVYQTATAWLVAASFPIYILLAVFAPTFMALFGREFASGAVPLTIISSAMLLNMSTGAVKAVLLMGGRSRMVLADNVAALVANVVLNLLLIPRFGILGAAIAWSVSIGLNNVIPAFQVRSAWRMQPVSQGSVVAATAALASFGLLGIVLRVLEGSSYHALLETAILGAILYFGALWRWRSTLHAGVLWDAASIRRDRRAHPAPDTV
jgi:O-antigen/teichoic acid export membrane protein